MARGLQVVQVIQVAQVVNVVKVVRVVQVIKYVIVCGWHGLNNHIIKKTLDLTPVLH